ncbi:histidine kinase [Siphonobacter curvatus]|uniref:Signal transduction histidine kinase internal region domain-containing protein n=1 Tax=Siphonobacter curvatus TaxID=2094562 RepID=A0A2S7IPT1_9BACT|nr:histidine kinase [Siphonobacter curvatus]PQA59724.1 hypothetical protein C5O19_08855 [Siphonobacter curvatus]
MLYLPRHRTVFITQFIVLFLFWYLVKYYLSKDTLYLYTSTFLVAFVFALMGLLSYEIIIKSIFSTEQNKSLLGRIFCFGSVLLLSQVVLEVVNLSKSIPFVAYVDRIMHPGDAIKSFMVALSGWSQRTWALSRLLGSLVLYSLLGFCYLAVDTFYRRRQLSLAARESELGLLKTQINPHFLYNALNTIYGQSLRENQSSITESIQQIATQARKMLTVEKALEIPAFSKKKVLVKVSVCLGLVSFAYYAYLYYITHPTPENAFLPFIWYKIIAGVEGTLVKGLIWSIFTYIYFRFLFQRLWTKKDVGIAIVWKGLNYLAGLWVLAFAYWIVINIQFTFNQWLVRIGSPYQGSIYGFGTQYFWEVTHTLMDYQRMLRSVWVIWVSSTIPYLGTAVVYQAILWYQQSRHLEKQVQKQKKLNSNPYLLDQLQSLLRGQPSLVGTATGQSFQQLVALMAYIQDTDAEKQVPLTSELTFVKAYLDFQRKRIPTDTSIVIQTELPTHIPALSIAPLLLIPFIENAFQYGIRTDAPCWIRLEISCKGSQLIMKLANTVVPQTNLPNSSGIGLKNVKKRLHLLYDRQHTLEIHSNEHTYQVYLCIHLDHY